MIVIVREIDLIKELDAKELFIRLGLETHIRTKNVLIQIHLCEYLGCY